jgi:hypothetical protein
MEKGFAGGGEEGVPEGGGQIKKVLLLLSILLLPSLMVTIIPGWTCNGERLPEKRCADMRAGDKGGIRRKDAGLDVNKVKQAANPDVAGKIKGKDGKQVGPTRRKPAPGWYQSTGRQCCSDGLLKSI